MGSDEPAHLKKQRRGLVSFGAVNKTEQSKQNNVLKWRVHLQKQAAKAEDYML